VILGVADKASDAEAVKNIYGVVATKFNRFLITGVEHEAKHKNGLDGYFRWLVTLLKKQPVPDAFKDMLARELRLVRYFDKSVVIFRTLAAKEPVHYDGKYYVRHGTSVVEVKPQDFNNFYSRFK
jgi:hypothetical protein